MRLPRQRRRDNRRRQYGAEKTVGGFRLRAWVACGFVVMGFAVVGVRLLTLGFMPYGEVETSGRIATFSPFERGDIVDANGELMATTLNVYSLFADPANVLDVDRAAKKLPAVLPELSANDIRQKLSRSGRFVWLKRALTPAEVYAVNALGLPGLGFRQEERRLYPQENMAAHLVGTTSYDGKGISGVEGGYEEALSSGHTIELTVDMRLQRALHDVLAETMTRTAAKGAWGITLDANTAEVKAMVSLPDYDANTYGKADPAAWLNKNISGVYEMGSTFKIFTMAMAKQELNMKMSEEIDCTKPLSIGGFKIRDSHPKAKWLRAREVFAYSSNIGAAQIADRMGPEIQRTYFEKLGLLEPLDVGLLTSLSPMYPEPHRWKRIATMAMSYGHGIAVTPMQMVAAARAAAVDGVWKQPTFTKGQKTIPPRQVFTMQTVRGVRELLGDVIDYGTGSKAAVYGYKVGGKTGTSEKTIAGGYAKDKHIASFFGMMPLENPRFVTLIMVDEADGGAAGGGTAAAPAFAEFAKQAAALLGIVPTEKTIELLPTQAQTERLQAAVPPKVMPQKHQQKVQKAANDEIITAYYHPTYN